MASKPKAMEEPLVVAERCWCAIHTLRSANKPGDTRSPLTLIWQMPGGSGKRSPRSLPMVFRRRHEPSAS